MRIIIAVLLGVLALSSCSDEQPTASSTTGSYKSSDGKFVAEVANDLIEIHIVGESSKSLYWSGTWESGERVTSQADVEKLNASMLGSQNDAKEFEVDGDNIAFEFSIMGTTSEVVLEKE